MTTSIRKLKEKLYIRDIKESDAALMERYSYRFKKDASEYRLSYYYDESVKGVHRTLVAEYNGNIAGYINVCIPGSGWHKKRRCSADETYLYDLYVIWVYRKKGIGQALLEEAFRIATGCSDYVSLNVEVGNTAAAALYRKQNFCIVRVEENAGVQEYLLRKKLEL